MMDKQSKPVKIGYILNAYPAQSVEAEILALRRTGIAPTVFYLQRSSEQGLQPFFDEATVGIRIRGRLSWKVFWLIVIGHSWGMITRPWRYLKALGFTVRRGESGRFRELIQALHLSVKLKSCGIQHIHVVGFGEPTAVAAILYDLCGIRYSVATHTKDFCLLRQRKTRKNLAKAEFISTSSEYDQHYLQAVNLINVPVHCIYQGLNPEWFDVNTAKPVPVSENGLISILSVGQLTEKMGFACLVKACAHLKAAGHRFRCNIVGTGPEQESLQRLLNKYELNDSVYLRGSVEPALMKAIYIRANIFVLPCQIPGNGQYHGIPTALLEAMAMALPVVSTKALAIPEAIEHEKNGLLVEPDSPLNLARALITLFEDNQLRIRLGNAACFKVEKKFRIDRNVLCLKSLMLRGLILDDSLAMQKLLSAD